MNFILGEKDAGKSILLDCIADVDGARNNQFVGFPRLKQISYLSQGNNFDTELTVKDILDFMKQLDQVNNLNVPEVISKMRDVKFGLLCNCERRILLVYINIMIDRELYILDEPETDVELEYTQEMFEWFRELTELGKTVIISTHKLDNIHDVDNVNYIKNPQEVLSDSFLKIKARMAF